MRRIELPHIFITETLTYLALGVCVYFVFLWPLHTVLLTLLAILLATRGVATLLLFAIAWRNRAARPPEMRIGPLRTLRLVLGEYLAILLCYTIFLPLEPLLIRRSARVIDGTPILLVHGFLCNGGFWWFLMRRLQKQGIRNLHTINLSPVFGSINLFAKQVESRVDAILEQSGAEQVILLGHSMGGLASRAYVQHCGGADKVAKIITLGTPHHGTRHAKMLHGDNVQQMSRTDAWLATLNQDEDKPFPVPITSIYSYHDNIVAPQDSSHLANANNIALAGLGHCTMAISGRIEALLLKELAEG